MSFRLSNLENARTEAKGAPKIQVYKSCPIESNRKHNHQTVKMPQGKEAERERQHRDREEGTKVK